MQIGSNGDSLHEMSNSVDLKTREIYLIWP